MPIRRVVAAATALALCGCLQQVTIPPLEASIKEACHGEDRLIASGEGASAYRGGKGSRARYAVYRDGTLFREVTEDEVADFTAGLACLQRGYRLESSELAACRAETVNLTVAQRNQMRGVENAEAPAPPPVAEPLQLQAR